jgi:DNA-binding CsgD family transcriptional regulator
MQLWTRMAATLSPQNRTLNSGFPIDCLLLALHNYRLGIAVVDRRLRFSAINPILAEMNNLPPEAHPGKPLHEVLGPLIAEVEPQLEHVFTTGQPLPKVQLTGQLPTRLDPVHWLQYFFPLVDKRGRVVEVGAFVIERKSSAKLQGSLDLVPSPLNGECPLNSGHMLDSDASYHPAPGGPCQIRVNLSGREREVLQLLATGKSNKEISSVLAISVKTVETYRSRLMLKIQAPSLSYLVHYAIRHQIVRLQA